MKNSNSYQSASAHKSILAVLILIVLAFLIPAIKSSAQDSVNWKLNSVSISSGETPLSSGLAFSAKISRGKSVVLCDYNSTLGEALYFYSPIKQFSFGYSGGVFKSNIWVFWAGPIASFSLFDGHLTTLNWAGWSLGDPEMEKTTSEIKFCFSYQQISLNWKFAEAYYALLHYQRCKPEHIFGTKFNFNLSEKISLCGGLGYMLNAEKYLWSTGLDYNF